MTEAVNMFYENEQAVNFTNQLLEDATNAGLTGYEESQKIERLVNADNATVFEQAAQAVAQDTREQGSEIREQVQEENSIFSGWLTTFVNSFRNSGNERRGSRDEEWDSDRSDRSWDADGNW